MWYLEITIYETRMSMVLQRRHKKNSQRVLPMRKTLQTFAAGKERGTTNCEGDMKRLIIYLCWTLIFFMFLSSCSPVYPKSDVRKRVYLTPRK
jgi:hypothetical protein